MTVVKLCKVLELSLHKSFKDGAVVCQMYANMGPFVEILSYLLMFEYVLITREERKLETKHTCFFICCKIEFPLVTSHIWTHRAS